MDTPELPYNRDLTYIGLASFRNKNQIFGIKRKDRRQHVYVLGKSGTGKSVLLSNMIIQNINNGEGVCVVDPHGELVEGVLGAIPPHRIKDVIYFNPADTDYHIGFNVLELKDPKYKHLVASGLMGIFTKIWANAWSARMEYILNNSILALLDTPGSTLLGIPRLLVDKDFRQKIINNLKDPVIKAFWIHEYEAWQDKFRNEAIAPIQNKVGQFLSTSIIRNVVGQAESTIDFFDIMNSGKIFLVNVSKGRIGEDNSALLGGMIITKIQLAAMERVRIPEDERKDFYLYVDEFQNFVTDSFASILSEARKYRLNLTVAHQYTAQLVTDNGSAVRDAVFGNVGTMIVFRVGADDADFLEKEFEPEFMAQDIVNLPNYRIYLKLMIDGITSRPFSSRTLPPIVKHADKEVEKQVIEMSRTMYARTKIDIEKEINAWSGMSLGDGPNISKDNANAEKFPVICSNCMKETTVPFKPGEGRPVYCKDCIAKMKSGELKPAKGSARQIKYDESSFFKPLADLGIEFESKDSTNKGANVNAPRSVLGQQKTGILGAVKKVFGIQKNPNQAPMPPKFVPKNNFNPNPGVPKVEIPKVEKPKENLALKEILGKVLNDTIPVKPIVKPVPVVVQEIKKPEPAPISLSSLKVENPVPVSNTLPVKDTKSASEEDKNTLKDLLLKINAVPNLSPLQEKVKDEVRIPEVKKEEIKIPEIKTSPQPSPEKAREPEIKSEPEIPKIKEPEIPVNNIREVPEDILRKLLEE